MGIGLLDHGQLAQRVDKIGNTAGMFGVNTKRARKAQRMLQIVELMATTAVPAPRCGGAVDTGNVNPRRKVIQHAIDCTDLKAAGGPLHPKTHVERRGNSLWCFAEHDFQNQAAGWAIEIATVRPRRR